MAFRAHANFVLQSPFSVSSATRVFRAALPLMIRERRRYYRHPIKVPALLRQTEKPEVLVNSINISETGMAVSTPLELTVGERIFLRIDLPKFGEPFTAGAEICWSANDRVGMRFVEVPVRLAERLQIWLSDRISELVTDSNPNGAHLERT